MYIENHGIPRSIRLDQAKCLVGHQVKTFCTRNNIEMIEACIHLYNPTYTPCVEPDQEIQIDFAEPIFDERGNDVKF